MSQTHKPGIPTIGHDGVKYRSITEARWAEFFHRLGWEYEYEPFELKGYIPDFILKFKEPVLVEVKAEVNLLDLDRYTDKIRLSGWTKRCIILGSAPHFVKDKILLGRSWIQNQPLENSILKTNNGQYDKFRGMWISIKNKYQWHPKHETDTIKLAKLEDESKHRIQLMTEQQRKMDEMNQMIQLMEAKQSRLADLDHLSEKVQREKYEKLDELDRQKEALRQKHDKRLRRIEDAKWIIHRYKGPTHTPFLFDDPPNFLICACSKVAGESCECLDACHAST